MKLGTEEHKVVCWLYSKSTDYKSSGEDLWYSGVALNMILNQNKKILELRQQINKMKKH